MNETFEFGETDASEAFLNRHPKFFPAFERLMVVGNKCFGRAPTPKSRAEHIAFGLGHACRADLLEVLFMGANGYNNGAMKLIRGLFERTVALAYIVKRPEKAERLVRFAAIQEYKGMNEALKLVSEEELDKIGTGVATVAEIRAMYEEVKPEFQVTRCDKCKKKGTAFSWDERDVASMVADVNEPVDNLFKTMFVGCYTTANFVVHTSLVSAMEYQKSDPVENAKEADITIANGIILYLKVLEIQSRLFELGIAGEIETCWRDFNEVWMS